MKGALILAAAAAALPLAAHSPVSNEASTAIAVARAHVEAWSHHDWDAARSKLAPDVHVTVTSTQQTMSRTDLTGIDNYMVGLRKFAEAVVPGSARIEWSVGDEHNALLMVTVKAAFQPGAAPVTLPAARLYQLDENHRIQSEQVIFFMLSQ